MKLSTRGRYAARLMLDLALHHREGFVLLKDVAARQEVSRKYLGHLVTPLKTAGLLVASRGAHGGYRLAKAPSETRLGEVVGAVEGELGLVECVLTPKVCHRSRTCVTHDIWTQLSRNIIELLNSITLQDMVERHKQKQADEALMWNI